MFHCWYTFCNSALGSAGEYRSTCAACLSQGARTVPGNGGSVAEYRKLAVTNRHLSVCLSCNLQLSRTGKPVTACQAVDECTPMFTLLFCHPSVCECVCAHAPTCSSDKSKQCYLDSTEGLRGMQRQRRRCRKKNGKIC